MENIWKKLEVLKDPLNVLNRREFKGIEQKISKAREEVHQIQEQMARNYSNSLARMEKVAIQQLEK